MKQFKNSPTVKAIEKSIAEQQERQERIRQSKLQCDDWNAVHPVGVNVVFRGEHTHTIGKASVGLNCNASVFLACRIGAVDLDSVEVVK